MISALPFNASIRSYEVQFIEHHESS